MSKQEEKENCCGGQCCGCVCSSKDIAAFLKHLADFFDKK